MKTSFFEQVTKALKDHGKRSRWLSVMLCLALVVSTGTFYAFMRQGQAKVHTEKVLACEFVVHEHDESCYDEEGTLVCGIADYVLHTHNDDCYDREGNLVCTLPEVEAHQHDESCYLRDRFLVCDHAPAGEGHRHTDACYEEREIEGSESACAREEHVHTEACYTQAGTGGEPKLTCGEAEHTHSDSCYEVRETEKLTCGEAEHTHDGSCYTVNVTEELTCGQSEGEEHTHDSSCYTRTETRELTCGQSEHSHGSGCYEKTETRELVCGEREHTHGSSCYSGGDAETAETLACGKEEHTHDESCGGAPQTERVLICGQEESVPDVVHTDDCYQVTEKLVCEKEELLVHVHDEDCYDEEGRLICGQVEAQEHVHGPECFITVTVGPDGQEYTCGKTAHTHGEGCYDENGGLRCPLEEHEHSDACLPQPEYICGKTAHVHDESCYSEAMELICGLEEHTHTAECLPEPEWLCGKMPHTHDETCYNAGGELVCPLEEHQHTGQCLVPPAEEPETEWLCGREEHTHSEDCYDEYGELVCGLREHRHTDLCLKREDEVNWLCGLTAHLHDESCYDEYGALICGLEEHEHTHECLEGREIEWLCGKIAHTHGPECYDEDGERICGLEEHEHTAQCLIDIELPPEDQEWICGMVAHTHGPECYDENGELICGLEEHVHTTDCLPAEEIHWLCGKVEHFHTPECYGEDGELICGLEEHEHTTACLVEQEFLWLCGKEEHTHGPECYDENGELICPLEEHVHTEECLMVSETILVSESYAYATESGLFDIVFQVEGPAILRTVPGEENAVQAPEAPQPEDAVSGGEMTSDGETASSEAAAPVSDGRAVTFQVAPLYEGDLFDLFSKAAEEQEEMLLDVLSVHIFCEGRELDVSGCKVTAEITPTELLRQSAAESAAVMYANEDSEDAGDEGPLTVVTHLTAYEAKEDESLSALNSMYVVSGEGETPAVAALSADPMDADYPEGETADAPGNDLPESMTATLSDDGIALFAANDVNPKFTVQYYAYIDRIVKNWEDFGVTKGNEIKDLIDTRGAALPQNGTTPKTMSIYRNGDGSVQHKADVLLPLFKNQQFNYFEAPGLTYYNILPPSENTANDHYELVALWILKPGCNPDSTNADDWEEYTNFSTLNFTNSAETAEMYPNYVLVDKGTVMRLVYDATDDRNYRNDAAFYDYDISDGYIYSAQSTAEANRHNTSEQNTSNDNEKWYAFTNHQGINSNGNNLGFGNGESNTRKGGLGNETVKIGSHTIALNQANTASIGTANHKNCAFELVTGMANGKIQYQSGINAPNLFNEGTAYGKTGFGGSLHFIRNGDTYTLSAVSGADTQESGLEKLSYERSNWNKTQYMYSNDFWPLDAASTWGADGHDMVFGKTSGGESSIRGYTFDNVEEKSLPWPGGDYKEDHNAYFGMNFSVDFTLTADYLGPLEYIFFGDDDMWVFLSSDGGNSGTLVCDIGGVHSSVGEYVDLKDWIPKDDNGEMIPGKYSLHFFYTERGASGSTCWMQFTLPQASSRPTTVGGGKFKNTVHVSKEVVGDVTDDEFEFQIILNEAGGKHDNYTYTRYDANGEATYTDQINKVFSSGDTFKLKHNEYIRVDHLPVGTTYTIKELGVASTYTLESRSVGVTVDGTAASGTIEEGDNNAITEVKLVNRELVKLPETGSTGPRVYSLLGAGLMAAGALLALRRKREK